MKYGRLAAQHGYRGLCESIAGREAVLAGREARPYVDQEREGVVRAARTAARGWPTEVSVDEMVAGNLSVIDRMRPIVDRAVGRLRARFCRK